MDVAHKVLVTDWWTVSEKHGDIWVPVLSTHNLLTTFGLNAYATAAGGLWLPPIYLVIDTASSIVQGDYVIGSTVIQLATNPTVAGDTTLVFDAGQVAQETVTFSSITGSGPYTVNLSTPTLNFHANNSLAVRNPNVNDTTTQVLSEAQYDPIFAVNMRTQVTSAYTSGSGKGVTQFFLTAQQATNLYFAHVGMADTNVMGGGNLHNYAVLGYNRNTAFDLEIDIQYVVANA